MTFQDDNGNQLISKGTFAMTKQAVSFFKFQIKGDVSINFNIDNNSQNRKTLGYYGPQMNQQVAWTKQAFNRLDEDGNKIDRGYVVIQDEDGPNLDCFYVSGNSNWVQLLNGLITSLRYPDEYSVIYGSNPTPPYFDATKIDGVIFPYVDWCFNLNRGIALDALSRFVDTRHDDENSFFSSLYPCLYLHSLLDVITINTGVKFTGDVLNNTLYRSIVITPTNGLMKRSFEENIYATGSVAVIAAAPDVVMPLTKVSGPDGLISSGVYTVNSSGQLKISITVISAAGAVTLYKNGVASLGTSSTRELIVNVVKGDVFQAFTSSSSTETVIGKVTFSKFQNVQQGSYVNPTNFLPKLKCIDIVKFIINYFGCSVYFNDVSKTISINQIENFKKEDALDWSNYYVSHRSEYTVNQAQNNYMRFAAANDADSKLLKYNQDNKVGYGEGNIKTGNTLKNEIDLIKFDFQPSISGIAKNGFYCASVPLVNLVNDGDPIAFTGGAISSAYINEYVVPDATIFASGEVISITNSDGTLRGYYYSIPYTATKVRVLEDGNAPATATGFIRRQSINYNEVGPRFLAVRPNTPINYFSTSQAIQYGVLPTDIISTFSYASFVKQKTGYPIDQWRLNCAIENPPDVSYIDPSVMETSFNKISSFLQNPDTRVQLLLPKSEYKNYDFSKFIYLKTEKLTGYFFPDSLVNYQGPTVPVEGNFYML